ncbi:MAG: hypothetical protein ACFNOL_01450, partial [Treponema maltophilum]
MKKLLFLPIHFSKIYPSRYSGSKVNTSQNDKRRHTFKKHSKTFFLFGIKISFRAYLVFELCGFIFRNF